MIFKFTTQTASSQIEHQTFNSFASRGDDWILTCAFNYLCHSGSLILPFDGLFNVILPQCQNVRHFTFVSGQTSLTLINLVKMFAYIEPINISDSIFNEINLMM